MSIYTSATQYVTFKSHTGHSLVKYLHCILLIKLVLLNTSTEVKQK